MKKNGLFFVMALSMIMSNALFMSCSKDNSPAAPPVANGIKCATGDTIEVAYGKSLDLSTVFSLDPADASGSLTYSLVQQVSYAEGVGNTTYQTLEVYTLSGNTLTSAATRVPDAFRRPADVTQTATALRDVHEAVLEVGVEGSDIVPARFIIQQIDKPALDPPKISLLPDSKYTQDGPNGAYLLTLQTSSQWTVFSQTAYKVEPYDYDPNNIWLYPSPNAKYIEGRNNSDFAGVRAGGSFDESGTGEYVIAFYSATVDGVDAAYQAAVAAVAAGNTDAVLYVNVNYVAPKALIGIKVNPNIGTPADMALYGDTTFLYRANGAAVSKIAVNFVHAILADGTERPYVSGDGPLLCGNFETPTVVGRPTGGDDAAHPGWYPNMYLAAAPKADDGTAIPWAVGTPVKFTITRPGSPTLPPDNTFMQDAWTVIIDTKVMAP